MARPVFRAVGVSKYFGTIRAIERINFEIYPGEIVGLLGDNGAGKSTFIKIISGVFPPTGGDLYLNDERIEFASPQVARDSGIETAYQDLMLVPQLDMAANFFLGREMLRKGFLGKLGFLDFKSMRAETARHLQELKVTVKSIHQKVGELSGGQRQAVAIARVGSWGTKLIILDEPTAALGVEESAHVLQLMRNLKQRGIPVIFITHTLPFAFAVCDRMVILRLGKDVANLDTKSTDVDEVVRFITGSSLSA